jgi:LPS export ABC transporter protein LptC
MTRSDRLFLPALAVMCTVMACEDKEIEERLPKDTPKVVLEKLSLTETKSGQKLWTLTASRAEVYDEIIKAEEVMVRFYGEDEDEFSVLNAPRGELNTRTHNILVKDNVVVVTSDSTMLHADSLLWVNDSAKILTDSYVKIIKKDGTVIEGRGLKTDPRLSRIEVIGEIRGASPIVLPDIRK